jgi:general secretion pathway protein D
MRVSALAVVLAMLCAASLSAAEVVPPPLPGSGALLAQAPEGAPGAAEGAEALTPEAEAEAVHEPASPPPAEEPAEAPPGPEAEAGQEEPVAAEPPPPGAVPARPAAPFPAPPPRAPAGFLVKFNNADVYEVIHTLGRIAGINYLIDPRVRGVVNVHTQGAIRREDALDLLYSILRVNGATAVKEGDLYHIVPMAEAKMEALPLASPEDREERFSPNRPVMRAFPLQYIAAAEMAKVIRPFLSGGGDATEVARANMIVVTDTAANMEKHSRLVDLFDADAFRTAGVKLFRLNFLDPEEMGRHLETIFGALDFGTKGGKPSGINFVPLARMNALLVVTASPRALEDVERWVAELDREPSGAGRAVYLYRVRHGKARDIADMLEKLYPGKAAPFPRPTAFAPRVAEPERPAAPARPEAAPAEEKGGAFDILLNEPMNALVIRGSASEYAAILDTLRTIDVYPRQVLLEVLIAEVQLDDALRLGIDWTFSKQSGDFSHDASLATSAAGITSGLRYVVDKTDRLTAALRSLANDGKVSVLSSPSVMSTNGKKSRIDVSDQVPIVSGRVTNPGLEAFITETVEYRDVGIILAFTPFINDEGIVTLEIEQEVSEVRATGVGASVNPTFFRRGVATTLIATQDRSIVLGGLIRERRERTRDGIPFFYKIPVFGWLFGARSDQVSRTELLIFITPRVISSVVEGTELSREFEQRVEELKRRIGEEKAIRRVPRSPGAE